MSDAPASAKRVFLTGASAGIGLAIAQGLAAAGCEIWGTSRDINRLPADLPRFHPVSLDLNDDSSLSQAFDEAQQAAGGRFDVLINNAGDGWFGPAAQMPLEALTRQFQTLAFGPFRLIQLALPGLRKMEPPGGLVINVTSLAARLPLPYAAAYNGAKAALSALTRTLRMEETDAGGRVRFVEIQPGDIRTRFNHAMTVDPSLASGDDSSRVLAAARKVLEGTNRDVDTGPPPEVVANCIRELVLSSKTSLPGIMTVGTFLQARLGPLGYRVLSARMLERTIRDHFSL